MNNIDKVRILVRELVVDRDAVYEKQLSDLMNGT